MVSGLAITSGTEQTGATAAPALAGEAAGVCRKRSFVPAVLSELPLNLVAAVVGKDRPEQSGSVANSQVGVSGDLWRVVPDSLNESL
jgi:hypothetical protein